MEPDASLPARSNRRGSSANTLGGKPRRTAGSPTDRPISRNARAYRVTESIISSTQPLHGGRVGGEDNDHRAGQALGAKAVLQKLADLTPPFANQGNDIDIAVCEIGKHAQQGGLATPGHGEHAQSLTFTDGEQSV